MQHILLHFIKQARNTNKYWLYWNWIATVEAIGVCIQEWFAVFGIPFTNMLKGAKGIGVSNVNVFPELTGIRGICLKIHGLKEPRKWRKTLFMAGSVLPRRREGGRVPQM